jgi:hypothetical protein
MYAIPTVVKPSSPNQPDPINPSDRQIPRPSLLRSLTEADNSHHTPKHRLAHCPFSVLCVIACSNSASNYINSTRKSQCAKDKRDKKRSPTGRMSQTFSSRGSRRDARDFYLVRFNKKHSNGCIKCDKNLWSHRRDRGNDTRHTTHRATPLSQKPSHDPLSSTSRPNLTQDASNTHQISLSLYK